MEKPITTQLANHQPISKPMEQTQIDFGKMTKLEKCEYFIKKFEAIPEEKWITGTYINCREECCALGHCGERYNKSSFKAFETPESTSLAALFGEFLSAYPSQVNDGDSKAYPQLTPKLRILAALSDIKAKIEKGGQ